MDTNVKSSLTGYFGKELRQLFKDLDEPFFRRAEEIRLRVGRPILISLRGGELSLTAEGKLTEDLRKGYKPSFSDIAAVMELASGYSCYAFEEELRNGYLTIPGGHRIGLSGRTVLAGSTVKTIQNISSLNIRISHEMIGCGDEVFPFITSPELTHSMIISPPACGKTTLLRDLIRRLSYGGQTVGVVDERSELAGCYRGVAQNDLGPRTDVLDGCPKAEGMIMLLRAMAPRVIAVDEIGKAAEIHAIEDIVNAGVKLICTVHGRCVEDILQRPQLSELLKRNIFRRFILLKRPGEMEGIYDEKFKRIDGSQL